MKNKRTYLRPAVVFFLLTVATALLSWIGSIHGGGAVQSLLSEEGVRWLLRHVVGDYVQTPALGIVLVVFMGLGIGIRAGLYDACRRFLLRHRPLSGKERRALSVASAVLLCYAVTVALSTYFLRSITGGFDGSPFQKGFFYIFSLGLGLAGVVYGYIADTYRTTGDVLDGMSSLIARRADYFVTLFFVVQFFSVLSYTRLGDWAGITAEVSDLLFQLCCYLPLFVPAAKRS